MRNYLIEKNYTIEYKFDFVSLHKNFDLDELTFSEYMTALQHDEFLSMFNPKNRNVEVVLLPKGDYAAVSYYFIRQNRKILWDLVRDISTILVAIATIITLLYSIKESNNIKEKIPQIQEDINTLKQQLPTERKAQNTDNHLRIYSTDTLNVKVSK